MGNQSWATRIGVILAVAGSAIGLGNFLRFPGLAAQFEGGAFMIPYFVAFFLVGLPIAWVEWTMGRYGGTRGYNSMPGIFRVICKRHGASPYIGVLGLIIPVIIYMFYVYIEAWCLAFAIHFLMGSLNLGQDPDAYKNFTYNLVGIGENGAVFNQSWTQSILPFLLICVAINFFLIWRGLNKGIELFCQIALPMLVVLALIIMVHVLVLPRMSGGLAMTWNPNVPTQYLAAGDSALEGFLATNQARLMIEGAVEIDNVPEFEAELMNNGWLRPTNEDDRQAELIPWRHPDNDLGLVINELGQVALFREATIGQTKLLVWEPIDTFNQLRFSDVPLLILISKYDKDAPTTKQLSAGDVLLPDETTFIADAELSGWAPMSAGDIHGLWVHDQSKLRLDWLNDDRKVEVVQKPFFQRLFNAEMWIAAAGQILFSLTAGLGAIIVYASYLKRKDDVALSSMTAASGNGFAEVCIGGMVTIPIAFAVLGPARVNEVSNSLFSLGFIALPNVFAEMWMGQFFGFMFFFLLFLAAVTSSLSMLQPGIAFLEEAIGIGRRASVAILGIVTIMGMFFVVYFSKELKALDTLDYWIANLFIVLLALIQMVLFGWVLGIKKGMAEMEEGAEIKLPPGLGFVIKYVSPIFLITLFTWWIWDSFVKPIARGQGMPDRINDLLTNPVAQMSVGLIALVGLFFVLLTGEAKRRWARKESQS